MRVRVMCVCAILASITVLCGCVGYFHYHPVKSSEQMEAREVDEGLFSTEPLGAPLLPPRGEETLAEEELIRIK